MKQEQLDELLESLTLDEKIGQLVQLNGNFFDSNEKVATGPVQKIGIDKDNRFYLKYFRSKRIKNASKCLFRKK